MTRKFTDAPAVRGKTPLFIGLVSPSTGGKTKSALRLADGIRRVTGGEVFGIDSEQSRMLHYAPEHKFRHVSFSAPHGPADYQAVIEYCMERAEKLNPGVYPTIVLDSTSHEHEGSGGVLEMHEAELTRIAGTDYKKRDACQMLAWAKPKAQRRRLIQAILQMPANFIFCFRAKRSVKPAKGGPIDQGFTAIGGAEWIYEMTIKLLLLPGSDGVPTIKSDLPGERDSIKVPGQFRHLFENKPQLSEDIGEQLGMWANGGTAKAAPSTSVDELIERYEACDSPTLRALEEERRQAWSKFNTSDKARLKAASEGAKARIERAERAFEEQVAAGVVPRDESNDEQAADDDGGFDSKSESENAA